MPGCARSPGSGASFRSAFHASPLRGRPSGNDVSGYPRRRHSPRSAGRRVRSDRRRSAGCKADALTIGGDLYEAERAGPATVRFLFEQFVRFGKPVFLAPGNHDPHAPGSLLARPDLPENVLVFNEAAWRAIPLAEGITLYGFGHTPAEPGRPFASARFERGGVQIALVHGSDEARCPPNKRATAPFTQREVSASGASLLLTGHYHGGYLTTERGARRSPIPVRRNRSNSAKARRTAWWSCAWMASTSSRRSYRRRGRGSSNSTAI